MNRRTLESPEASWHPTLECVSPHPKGSHVLKYQLKTFCLFDLTKGANNCCVKYLNTHRVAAYWHKEESESTAQKVGVDSALESKKGGLLTARLEKRVGFDRALEPKKDGFDSALE